MKATVKMTLGIALLATLILFARSFGSEQVFTHIKVWVAAQGAWGPVFFVGIYALATVLALPGAPFTIAAGVLFGSLSGIGVALAGATLGASLSFIIARHVARDTLHALLAHNPTFQRIDRLTEKHGSTIVAVTRLVPLFPFNLLNYGFGLTKVPFSKYVFWSGLCMLPGTALYVLGTEAFMTALTEGRIPWLPIGVGGAVACLLWLLVRKFSGKLEDK